MKRLIVAAALSVLIVVGVFAYNTATRTTPNQPKPTPTATPSDPLAWYRSLPTASGCPTDLDPELIRQFYRDCPIPKGARK
jgi:hypothetical protein